MKCVAWLSFFVFSFVAAAARAQPPEDPMHAELRALRDDMVDAVNKHDMDRLLRHLHPNVVVTWQDAEVSRGPEGVRGYLTRMLEGPDRIVEDFSTSVSVDELTTLYGGDAGVAFGGSQDHFNLRRRMSFDLNSRWTATLVRESGEWKIAAFHASTNMFDNPLLARTRRLGLIGAAIALIAGIILGRFSKRRGGGARL